MDAQARLNHALIELKAVLRAVSAASTLDRNWAFRYTYCRDLVLKTVPRVAVPGFLYQCISVDNFHDFIRFYHHDVGRRHTLIDETLALCEAFRIEDQLARESSVRLGNLRGILMAPRSRAVAEI